MEGSLTLEALYEEVGRLADARLAEILVRILTADVPDLPMPPDGCRKCTFLLQDYVRCKLAAHRARRRLWGGRGDPGFILGAKVESARREFHAASCDCGLELWRGRRWRERNLPHTLEHVAFLMVPGFRATTGAVPP